MTEKEYNKYVNKVIAKEKEKFPKEIEILKRILLEDLSIKVKENSKEYIAKKAVDFFDEKFEERAHINWLYKFNIMMQNGEPRLGIEVYDMKQYAWHQEHMPGINYFPEFLLLEEYGRKWLALDKNGEEIMLK